ncbi:MAG: penicillin acylase family protein [Microthrixaceae bacterium]
MGAVGLLAVGACSDTGEGDAGAPETPENAVEVGSGDSYRATIVRTQGGVPHISGERLADVTFGQGYASGEDHACSLADQVLKIRGRRAEFLGAGADDANINSDFAWRAIGIAEIADADYEAASDEVQELMTSFAAGWNAHLSEVGADGVTGWCAGEPWVVPLEPTDIYAYARAVALNASGARLTDFIASAAPPGGASPEATEPTTSAVADAAGEATTTTAAEEQGSNGWAIGSDNSEGGGGMLLANPHFPWQGELRFWEVHLSVTGDDASDIYGAQLTGLPGVGIGATDEFAWTHTVSAGSRFTAYSLALAPGDPTAYVVDGQTEQMTSDDVTIKVAGDDGEPTEQTRTMYRTEFGPVIDFPGVGWTEDTAITYRDANIDNGEFVEQYRAMDTAQSFDEFVDAHAEYQGVPLFNTIAVSKDGRAWYADTSATPNLSSEAIAAYEDAVENDFFTKTAAESGAVLLDGSKGYNRWEDAEGARDPGLVPYDKMPQLERADYVFNANDSFWLANGNELIEGDYSPLHGRQNTERSARTLQNLSVLDGTDKPRLSDDDGKYNLDELQVAALDDNAYTAAQLRRAVVGRCQDATGPVELDALIGAEGDDGEPGEELAAAGAVDLTDACRVLDEWDGHFDPDSAGAPLWREFLRAFGDETFWLNEFDVTKPLETPSGLVAATPEGDPVLDNLAMAVQLLESQDLKVNVTLGELQKDGRVDDGVAIPGGLGSEGITNVVGRGGLGGSSEPNRELPDSLTDDSTLTPEGYPVTNGSSFIMAVTFGDDGPQIRTILTYGQTGDQDSPLFTEQTQMFSEKQWKTVSLDPEVIAENAIVDPLVVQG